MPRALLTDFDDAPAPAPLQGMAHVSDFDDGPPPDAAAPPAPKPLRPALPSLLGAQGIDTTAEPPRPFVGPKQPSQQAPPPPETAATAPPQFGPTRQQFGADQPPAPDQSFVGPRPFVGPRQPIPGTEQTGLPGVPIFGANVQPVPYTNPPSKGRIEFEKRMYAARTGQARPENQPNPTDEAFEQIAQGAAKIANAAAYRNPSPTGPAPNPVFGEAAPPLSPSQQKAQSQSLQDLAGGLSDVFRGSLSAALPQPIALTLMAAAPVEAAVTMGAQAVTEQGLKSAGVPAPYAAIIGDAVGIMAGYGGIRHALERWDGAIAEHNAVAERLLSQERSAGAAADLTDAVFRGESYPLKIGDAPATVEYSGASKKNGRGYWRVMDADGKQVFSGTGPDVQAWLRSQGAVPNLENAPAERPPLSQIIKRRQNAGTGRSQVLQQAAPTPGGTTPGQPQPGVDAEAALNEAVGEAQQRFTDIQSMQAHLDSGMDVPMSAATMAQTTPEQRRQMLADNIHQHQVIYENFWKSFSDEIGAENAAALRNYVETGKPLESAAQPTIPEAPNTLQSQLDQLVSGDRRAVMFPKGTPLLKKPKGMRSYTDSTGNTFIFNPKLTSQKDIDDASQNNALTDLLGATQGGMGAPDKTELQGKPVAVVAKDAQGETVQGTLTDQPNLGQTVQQTEKVTPPDGSVQFERPEDELAHRISANEGGDELTRGDSDIPMDQQGREDIQEEAPQIAPVSKIYHGPLDRTTETAEIISASQPNHPPLISVPDTEPWRLGALEGQPHAETKDYIERLMKQEPDTPAPGIGPLSPYPGESHNQFVQRFLPAFQPVLNDYLSNPGERIMFVTHSRNLRVLDAWVQAGARPDYLIDQKALDNPVPDPGETLLMRRNAQGRFVITKDDGGPGVVLVRHGETEWNEHEPDQKPVQMSRQDFVDEHEHLVDVLRSGSAEERQREADEQAAELRQEAPPQTHDYSSTQVPMPEHVAQAMQQFAAGIPDAELNKEEGGGYGGESASDGREHDSHITVKYGLETKDPEKVAELLKGQPPITATLGKTSLFKNDDSHVLKVDVDSPDLHRLNGIIAQLPNGDKHPDYIPHATIAYLKPDAKISKQYDGIEIPGVTGQKVVIDRVTFSGKDGKRVEIPLTGAPQQAALPQESGTVSSTSTDRSRSEKEEETPPAIEGMVPIESLSDHPQTSEPPSPSSPSANQTGLPQEVNPPSESSAKQAEAPKQDLATGKNTSSSPGLVRTFLESLEKRLRSKDPTSNEYEALLKEAEEYRAATNLQTPSNYEFAERFIRDAYLRRDKAVAEKAARLPKGVVVGRSVQFTVLGKKYTGTLEALDEHETAHVSVNGKITKIPADRLSAENAPAPAIVPAATVEFGKEHSQNGRKELTARGLDAEGNPTEFVTIRQSGGSWHVEREFYRTAPGPENRYGHKEKEQIGDQYSKTEAKQVAEAFLKGQDNPFGKAEAGLPMSEYRPLNKKFDAGSAAVGANGFLHNKVHGEGVWTDGHVAFIGEAPGKLSANETQPDIERVWNSARKDAKRALTPVGFFRKGGITQIVFADKKGNSIALNGQFYDWARKHFPNSTFRGSDSKSAVSVFSGDKMVGVIMPTRAETPQAIQDLMAKPTRLPASAAELSRLPGGEAALEGRRRIGLPVEETGIEAEFVGPRGPNGGQPAIYGNTDAMDFVRFLDREAARNAGDKDWEGGGAWDALNVDQGFLRQIRAQAQSVFRRAPSAKARGIQALINALDAALKLGKGAIFVPRGEDEGAHVRHEASHSAQRALGLIGHIDAEGFLDDDLVQHATSTLLENGYPDSDEIIAAEIGAHLAEGPSGWADMGVTPDEAEALRQRYLRYLLARHSPSDIFQKRGFSPILEPFDVTDEQHDALASPGGTPDAEAQNPPFGEFTRRSAPRRGAGSDRDGKVLAVRSQEEQRPGPGGLGEQNLPPSRAEESERHRSLRAPAPPVAGRGGETAGSDEALGKNPSLERGAIPASALVAPVEKLAKLAGFDKFVEQDVLPRLSQGGQDAKSLVRGLVQSFSPRTGVSTPILDMMFKLKGDREKAQFILEATVDHMREQLGEKADMAVVNRIAQNRQDLTNLGLSPLQAFQVDVMDRIKTGRAQETPELQSIADFLRHSDDALYREITKFKPGLTFLENHQRVIWKVIPGSKGAEKRSLGRTRRPLQGSRGYMKQHVFENMTEGIEEGGVPLTYNPVEMFTHHYADVMKFLTAQKMWKAAKKLKARVYVRQEGWVPVDDAIARVYLHTPEDVQEFAKEQGEYVPGISQVGQWYVEPGFGRLLNNYLSPDKLRAQGTGLGAAGRALIGAKNLYTAFELAIPGFHFAFISGEAGSSAIGLGISKLINQAFFGGNPKAAISAGKDILRGVTVYPAARHAWRTGDWGIKLIKDPAGFSHTPEGQALLREFPDARQLMEDIFAGGAKLDVHHEYIRNGIQSFQQAVHEGNYPGALFLRGTPALIELMQKPLFEWYIPRVKVGVFLREFSNQLIERNADLAAKRITRAELARKTWDFVEDRFGEMNFDNLFWDRTFKTAMQILFRSPTWLLGSGRAAGKAVVGQAKELGAAFKGRRPPRITPEMAWMFGVALLTAAMSTVAMKMWTGRYPQTLRDIFYPQYDPADDRQRMAAPTYASKDWWPLLHDPLSRLTGGASGVVSKGFQVLRNRNYWGQRIWNEDDPGYRKAIAMLKYMAPGNITVQNAQRLVEQGEESKLPFAALGINKAPAYVSMTPAEQKIRDYMKENGVHGSPDAERARIKGNITRMVRMRRFADAAKIAQQGIQAGRITDDDVEHAIDRAQQDPLQVDMQRLNVDQALNVLALATAAERPRMLSIVMRQGQRDNGPWLVRAIKAQPAEGQRRSFEKLVRIGLLRPEDVPAVSAAGPPPPPQ